MTPDYYETLQVHPRADEAAIEAAYARLIERYDPARLDGAADELVALAQEKRAAIEAAYATLSDPARRAAYDAELANLSETKDQRPKTNDQALPVGPSPSALGHEKSEELLDYRPLPPAKRQERPRDFDPEPHRSARVAGRAPRRTTTQRWAAPAALASALVLIVAVSLALTGGAGLSAATPTPTPTPSPLDQFEAVIPQARQAAEQNPSSAQGWVDLGNLLYDSIQVVRETAPDSELYKQRIGRWLEATTAYSQALALEPDNAPTRADMGASACFYGAGAGDQSYVRSGTDEVRRAAQIAPNDARVLLSLGYCLVSAEPPQTAEAVASWRRIVKESPSSPLASQAQTLIAKYDK